MLKEHKKKSVFFVSQADVPTVTGPRLQAMTSGNFPPLSKLLDNFHASEITEDNIMFQLNLANKKSFFVGDNTWMGLFPRQFTTAYPMESFNIGDQYTVDNFNNEMLLAFIDRGYDFVVAHFLGLDHAGHSNGRVFNNTDLDSKLEQLSDIIYGIYDKMDKDSILIIAGDHGMANDGNHGGNSTEETNTIFFATRKTGHFKRKAAKKIKNYSIRQSGLIRKEQSIRTINQIDIVPTLAKLLGIAIPYSNLGIILPEMVINNQDCIDNMNQILRFVNDVHDQQFKFTKAQIESWNQQATQLKHCENILPFLKEIQIAARSIWSQYDFTLLNLSFLYSAILIVLFITIILQSAKLSKDNSAIQSIYSNKYHIYSTAPIFLSLRTDWKHAISICLISNASLILVQTVKWLKDNFPQQKEYQTTQINIQYNSYLLIFSLIFFLIKILFQAMLLLSIENKRNEMNYLFYQIIFFVFLISLQRIFYQTLRFINNDDPNKNKQRYIYATIRYLLFIVILYILLFWQQNFYEAGIQVNTLQQWRIIRIYLPSLVLQFLLYHYIKKYDYKDKLYLHFMLCIVELYFVIEFQQIKSYMMWLPRIIYLLSLKYIFNRDLIYIFMACLMVSDAFGLAIYCLMFSILYMIHSLNIKHKYSSIILVSISTLMASWTWFVLGNKCTISSVKVGRAFVGLESFSLVLSPIILTLYLIGPFVGVAMFLNRFSKNRILTKIMFLLIFYIQVMLTEIHSYVNAGGMIEIQFKYIFDAVTYIIILIIACGM